MDFGEKIRNLRLESKLTQEQASNKMGISISSLRNYENGRLPDTHQLKIIKNFYNVSYEYLLEDNCENRTDENINIYKELSLTDSTIKKLKDIKKSNTNNIINLFFNSLNMNFWNEFDEYIFVKKLNYEYGQKMEKFLDTCEDFFYILNDTDRLNKFLCNIDEMTVTINELRKKFITNSYFSSLLSYYDCDVAYQYLFDLKITCENLNKKYTIEEVFDSLISAIKEICCILEKIYLVSNILKLNLANRFNSTLSEMKGNKKSTSVLSKLYDNFESYLKELKKDIYNIL